MHLPHRPHLLLLCSACLPLAGEDWSGGVVNLVGDELGGEGEEGVVEESSSSDEENSGPHDFEGGGGFLLLARFLSPHALSFVLFFVYSDLQSRVCVNVRACASVCLFLCTNSSRYWCASSADILHQKNSLATGARGAGLTRAMLWGNVMIATSWDGLIRVWVYTEE